MEKLNKVIVAKEKIKLLKPYTRVFQGIVSLFSNLHFNIFNTQLIMKYEGGVEVNQREIVIYNDHVRDDFKPLDNIDSTEEKIVVRIIEKIFVEVDFNDLPNSLENWVNKEIVIQINEKLGTFVGNPYGDQLNSFFEE